MFSMHIINIMNTPSLLQLEAQLNLRISQINLHVSIFRETAELILKKYCSQTWFDFGSFVWDSSQSTESSNVNIDLTETFNKLHKTYRRFNQNYGSLLSELESLCASAKIEGFNSSISEEKRELYRVSYSFETAEQISVVIEKLSSYVNCFLTEAALFLKRFCNVAIFTGLHKQVYDIISANGEITCCQLSDELNVDKDTLERILTNLLDAELIDCTGVQRLHVHPDNPACITRIEQPFKYKINLAASPDVIRILFS